MGTSIRFKPRQIVALLGAMLLAFGMVLGVTVQSAKAASSAGIPYTVAVAAGATPGSGTVTLTLTQNIGIINGTITPEATITLNGDGKLGVGGRSVSIPIIGKTGDVLPPVRYSCVTVGTTITVLGYEATPFAAVTAAGDLPLSCGGTPPPVVDTDGDKVPDVSDKCPTVPAATPDGCPVVVPPPNEDDGDNGDVKKVAFCHAKGNGEFVAIETSVNAFYQAGHDTHQDGRDIVKPFTYVKHGKTISFPGLNWDAAGQAFFANGCKAVEVTVPITPTPPTIPATPPTTPVTVPATPVSPVIQAPSETVVTPVQPVVPAAAAEQTSAEPLAFGPDISQQSLGEAIPPVDSTQETVSKWMFIAGLVLLMAASIAQIRAGRSQRQ